MESGELLALDFFFRMSRRSLNLMKDIDKESDRRLEELFHPHDHARRFVQHAIRDCRRLRLWTARRKEYEQTRFRARPGPRT